MLLTDNWVKKSRDGAVFNLQPISDNPLICQLGTVLRRVTTFKSRAKQYYFDVILSAFRCPVCGGRLQMLGDSRCACPCGNVFDPTISFQKSPCCQANLVRKTYHYSCSRCSGTVSSRFIFDEKIFDKAYFRELMRESRERGKKKKAEIRRLLAESRSDELELTGELDFDSIPGFFKDLNGFIQAEAFECILADWKPQNIFDMAEYRRHITSVLGWNPVPFSEIAPLSKDLRTDKAWRFITLVFMQNDREVDIEQAGNDLLIQRAYNEAYCQG